MSPSDALFPPPPATFLAGSFAPVGAATELVDGVAALLRLARGLVTAGRAVDLAGLDRMVGLLCARALDLPPEEGRRLRPRLAALLAELDGLGSALAAASDAAGDPRPTG